MGILNGRNKKQAMLSTHSDDNIKCNLCSRDCLISPKKSGYCNTRFHENGQLHSIIYGIISKLSIDPIEEKPFRHFHPGTKCLSIGTYGCNFRCKGCQNVKVSWGADELDKLNQGELDQSIFIPPDVLVQIAKELCCDGIAFTYNEPAIWLEYVVDVAKIAKQRGLYTVYVTNSALSQKSIDVLASYIDAIATDIKSTKDAFYHDICAVPQAVDKVLASIEYAHRKGIHIETRTNIIPSLNDEVDVFYGISHWIKEKLGADSPWHITKFYPATELSDISPTPKETLEKAFTIAQETGLQNVYLEDKPCDCAQGETSDQIKKLLMKYQRNGVILNAGLLCHEDDPGHCTRCS